MTDTPNHDDKTPPLADDAPSPASSPSAQDAKAPADEPSKKLASGDPEHPAAKSSGGSSGGFDTMLGKLVIQQGLVTSDELQQCRSHLRAQSAGTLTDVLLSNDFVTRRQMARLKREFEARKSTQRIPGYRIKRKLGAGAMATVFLAEQVSLDRLVAIKVLPKKFSGRHQLHQPLL